MTESAAKLVPIRQTPPKRSNKISSDTRALYWGINLLGYLLPLVVLPSFWL